MADPVSEELFLPGGGFSAVLLGRISHPRRVYVCSRWVSLYVGGKGEHTTQQKTSWAGTAKARLGPQSVCCFAQRTALFGGSDSSDPYSPWEALVKKWTGGSGRK